MRKMSDGMIVCKHGMPFDSECKVCQQNAVDRYKRVDDIFKSGTYTGENQKYEINNSLKQVHNINRAKHICLWGAPGTGKSTIAAGLFYNMKIQDYDAELVQEFAKDLIYSEDFNTLSNQFYVLARQAHNWHKLNSKVTYVIHDSPFLLGLLYTKNDGYLPMKEYTDFVVKMFKNYDTLNIFLLRNENNKFQISGRIHTEEEAYQKQNEIAKFLLFNDIEHVKITSGADSVDEILKLII